MQSLNSFLKISFHSNFLWVQHYERLPGETVWKRAPLSPYLNNSLSRLAPLFSLHPWVWPFGTAVNRVFCLHFHSSFFFPFPYTHRKVFSQWHFYRGLTNCHKTEGKREILLINHLNINNPEAWRCIAHTTHMSAPAGSYCASAHHRRLRTYTTYMVHTLQ